MMKKKNYLVFISFVLLACSQSPSPVNQINVFMATADDHGQLSPAVSMPFGLMKAGPQTSPGGHSGYNFSDSLLLGFNHMHVPGVGCSGAGGNILIIPRTTESDTIPVKIDKESEIGTPSYYAVVFENNIKAEIIAGDRIAIHSYQFPENREKTITFDFGFSLDRFDSEKHTVANRNEITGFVSSRNVCGRGKHKTWYSIRTNQDFKIISDKGHKLKCAFQNPSVEVRVALSVINAEAASERIQENEKLSFTDIQEQNEQSWKEELSTIKVKGDNEKSAIFYTMLFRALQSPFRIDEKGKYRGSDGEIYDAPTGRYNGWSVWDTYRTKFPLFSLCIPDEMENMCQSLYELYDQGMPVWSSENEPVPSVRTEHSEIVLLDAINKGIIGLPSGATFKKMVAHTEKLEWDSPDKILESSYDCRALAEIARMKKDFATEKELREKSISYRKIWVEKFKTMDENSDIMHGDGLYEGTLWQYRWAVPFDIQGIIKLAGSSEKLVDELDYFFENNLYNMGNQPDIHTPFLFNRLGASYKTQAIVDKLLNRVTDNYYGTHGKWEKPVSRVIFQNKPKGFIPEMDDDSGTMSAWYVLASIGLFPTYVGSPDFDIFTPQFSQITLNVGEKPFHIRCENFGNGNIYIQQACLNKKPLEDPVISYSEIKNGGSLELILGAEPNHSAFKN